MKRLLFVLIALLPIFSSAAYAENIIDYAADSSGAWEVENALDDESGKISGRLVFDGTYDIKAALSRLLDRIKRSIAENFRSELGYGLELTAIALVCSTAIAIVQDTKATTYINTVCCSAAAMLIAGRFDGIINQALNAIESLNSYSEACLPAIFISAAASGAAASSAAKYAASCIAVDFIMNGAQKYVIPLIYAYLGISITRSIFDNPLLTSAAKVTKWCATTLMTITTLAFSAYISITGLIVGSTDAVAVKTARTVISTALPVVGGIISDASAVVLSAATVIKNTAGAFSLVSVCALCAGPFIELSVKMLVFRAAAAAADMLPGGKLPSLINDVGNTFSMLLGLVGCCGIMLFISIMSGIKAVAV